MQPAVLRACLHTLRILSRDRRALGPMVSDSSLLTLTHLGGINLLQPRQQQDKTQIQDQGDRTQTQIHGKEASGSHEAADSDQRCAVSFSECHSFNRRGNVGHLVLAAGKKDAREDDSEEDGKVDDGEVCRKEAMKVLCNIIYNSPLARERASALR